MLRKLCFSRFRCASALATGTKAQQAATSVQVHNESRLSIPQKEVHSYRETRKLSLRPESPAVTRFEAIYEKAKTSGQLWQAYSMAAQLVRKSKESSALLLECAMQFYARIDASSNFKAVFLELVSDRQEAKRLLPDKVLYYACKIGISDFKFTVVLLEHLDRILHEPRERSRICKAFLRAVIKHDEHNHDAPVVAALYALLLEMRFELLHGDMLYILREVASSSRAMPLLSALFAVSTAEELKKVTYRAVVPGLIKAGRMAEARSIHDLGLKNAALPDSQAADGLLKHYMSYSQNRDFDAVLRSIKDADIKLAQSTCEIVAAHYTLTCQYELLQQQSRSCSNADNYWAASLEAAHNHEALSQILTQMKLDNITPGPQCIQACLSKTQTLDEVESIMRQALEAGLDIGAAGYGHIVRQMGRFGELSRAQNMVDTYTRGKEIVVVQNTWRQYMIGLLQARRFKALDEIHQRLVLKDLSTSSTRNLMIRAHIQNNCVEQALSEIEEMQNLNLDIENATAFEFLQSVLRRRHRGRLPDVNDEDDKRPYLADIKQAITVLHRCMRSGGRVQPETWSEILMRLCKYEEFASLELLGDWLIAQYDVRQETPLYSASLTQRNLARECAQYPLNRLINRGLVAALVATSVRSSRAEEGMALIQRWHDKGVFVDKSFLKKRIKNDLRKSSPEKAKALRRQIDKSFI